MTEPAKILVVDDDESIRKVLTAALEDEGYLVDVAEDGKQAIKKSHAGFYNLALIDIRLPDMDQRETHPFIWRRIRSLVGQHRMANGGRRKLWFCW